MGNTNNTRALLEQFLAENTHLERINTASLSKELGVTRQRVAQILNIIGETRHKRLGKELNQCPMCGIKITKNAQACRQHSHQKDNRVEGYKYRCKICNAFKALTEFTRSRRSPSGYENRCLGCRSAWQREYNKTRKGRANHKKAVKSLIDNHPERRRAYYQVFRALKEGTLTRQPCKSCGNDKSQAIHTDYNQPLNVEWMCRLCASRDKQPPAKYKHSKIEEQFRNYISNTLEKSNVGGKWLSAIKQFFNVPTLDKNLLLKATQHTDTIPGIGDGYTKAFNQFLNGHNEADLKNLTTSTKPVIKILDRA
jgi:hypothetical protein